MTAYEQGYIRNRKPNAALAKSAVEAAKNADVVLVFAGLDEISESEGLDRTHMHMPQAQNELIEKQYENILEIGTDYNGVGKIQYLIGENKIPVLESEYTDKVRFQVLLPMSETEHFQKLLTEATNARASQEIVDSCYYAVWNGKILMGDELRG